MKVQVDIDESFFDGLDCPPSREAFEEMFGSMCALWTWAVQRRKEGRIIASMDEAAETYRQVKIPAIEAYAPREIASEIGTSDLLPPGTKVVLPDGTQAEAIGGIGALPPGAKIVWPDGTETVI